MTSIRPPNLILAGCVSKKNKGRLPAGELYDGPLWKGRKGYVTARAAELEIPWAILSGKFGIVHPSIVVAPYNAKLPTFRSNAWFVWLRKAKAGLRRVFELEGEHWLDPQRLVIEVHAGRPYVEALARVLGPRVTLLHPVRGLQIGEQLAWYKAQNDDPGEPWNRRRLTDP